MTQFFRIKEDFIDIKSFNNHLQTLKKYNYHIYDEDWEYGKSLYYKAYLDIRIKQIKLTYKFAGNIICVHTNLDGSVDEQQITGLEAYRTMSQYYKVPKFDNIDKIGSASPFLWYNPKFNCTRNEAICYDLNSAYAWGMLQPMPDTSVKPRSGTIKKGEIGFIELPNDIGQMHLTAIFKGYCTTIFPLMPSPFQKFVEKWYDKKKKSKTHREYMKAKNYLVFSVGYLQRTNPYLRSAIITYCNDYIKSLINEDYTLFCNTDSIVSLKEIPELKIGDNVGEWKVEHKGQVAYVDFSYQWNNDLPVYRGVPKSWFPKNWDILKHEIPHYGNKYYFDEKEIKIKRSKLWKNSLTNLQL